jgi:hypothetical protein
MYIENNEQYHHPTGSVPDWDTRIAAKLRVSHAPTPHNETSEYKTAALVKERFVAKNLEFIIQQIKPVDRDERSEQLRRIE